MEVVNSLIGQLKNANIDYTSQLSSIESSIEYSRTIQSIGLSHIAQLVGEFLSSYCSHQSSITIPILNKLHQALLDEDPTFVKNSTIERDIKRLNKYVSSTNLSYVIRTIMSINEHSKLQSTHINISCIIKDNYERINQLILEVERHTSDTSMNSTQCCNCHKRINELEERLAYLEKMLFVNRN
jgi:hypothetical protein